MWYAVTGEDFTADYTTHAASFNVWQFNLRYVEGSLVRLNGQTWLCIKENHGVMPTKQPRGRQEFWRMVQGLQAHVARENSDVTQS